MRHSRRLLLSFSFLVVMNIAVGGPVFAGEHTRQCFGEDATILGTHGNDVLKGTAGDDVIMGLKGFDSIFGGAGNDRICGNFDGDEIHGEDGDDLIDGGEGTRDLIYGDSGGDYLLTGGGKSDFASGGEGNDTIIASPTKTKLGNKLFGDAGDDVIYGATGPSTRNVETQDYIDGGPGSDRMFGQMGKDTLVADDGEPDKVDADGSTRDTCIVDPTDIIRGCENLSS